jgi:hypothetical protein
MTEISTSAHTIGDPYKEVPPLSYSYLGIDLQGMGFLPDDDPEVPTYRWREDMNVNNLLRARDYYHTLGIVVLGSNCIINEGFSVSDIQEQMARVGLLVSCHHKLLQRICRR